MKKGILFLFLLVTPIAQAEEVREVSIYEEFDDLSAISNISGCIIKDGYLSLASPLQNPSFERGGWNYYETLPHFIGERTSDWASDGKYSFAIYTPVGATPQKDSYAEIYQRVDLSDVTEIKFDLMTYPRMTAHEIALLIDTVEVWSRYWEVPVEYVPSHQVLKDISVDVSEWEGFHDIKLRVSSTYAWTHPLSERRGIQVDNFRIIPISYLKECEASSTTKKAGNLIISVFPSYHGVIPSGSSISLQLSNNNGSTWESAAFGSKHKFSSSGSELIWKISLRGDGSSTPKIDNLSFLVEAYDEPPVLSLECPSSVVGQETEVEAKASDPEGNPLTYSFFLQAPNGLILEGEQSKNKLIFTPWQDGGYKIEVEASDGFLSAKKECQLEVSPSEWVSGLERVNLSLSAYFRSREQVFALLRVINPGIDGYKVEVTYWAEKDGEKYGENIVSSLVDDYRDIELSVGTLEGGEYTFFARILATDGSILLSGDFKVERYISPFLFILLPLVGALAGVSAFILAGRGRRERKRKERPKERKERKVEEEMERVEKEVERIVEEPKPEPEEDEIALIQQQIDELEKELSKLK